MNSSMRELSFAEVNEVGGGLLFLAPLIPLIPIAKAFGAGFLAGGVVAGGVLTVADAVGLVKVF